MKKLFLFLCVSLAMRASAQQSIERLYPPMRNFQHNLFFDRISKQTFTVPQFDSLNAAGVTIRLISQRVGKNQTAIWKVDFPDNPKLLKKERKPKVK